VRLFARAEAPKPTGPVLRLAKGLRLAGVSLAAGMAVALGSCSQLDTRQNVGPCPVVGSLYDSARLVELTGKGPKAGGDRRTFKYWVAVTRRNQVVLAKQEFTVDVRFPRGADTVRKTETVSGIVIPRATETVSGTNFEVIVGLDLTPEQLAFNRAGKRFRMKVDE
jgi:hypothetical protein